MTHHLQLTSSVMDVQCVKVWRGGLLWFGPLLLLPPSGPPSSLPSYPSRTVSTSSSGLHSPPGELRLLAASIIEKEMCMLEMLKEDGELYVAITLVPQMPMWSASKRASVRSSAGESLGIQDLGICHLVNNSSLPTLPALELRTALLTAYPAQSTMDSVSLTLLLV